VSCHHTSTSSLVSLRVAPVLEPPREVTEGMQLRQENFGSTVEFYAPGLKRWQTREWQPEKNNRFLPISVTGSACALQCDHCQSKVLEGMITVPEGGIFELARRLQTQGTDGVLVSGGSKTNGEVPLWPHLEGMRRIKEELGMRVIVHSGVVAPDLAAELAAVRVDGVMLDIIGTDETIEEVYHLELTTADFERSLESLTDQGLSVIPHIVLGLHYGRLVGEWGALEMIARYPVSTLILVVLSPLVGTPMAEVAPPPLDDVNRFFAHARQEMPNTPINLGCGRPMGTMKVALDKSAVDNGLNGIAYPADGIVEYAQSCGLKPRFFEYCCSLTWT